MNVDALIAARRAELLATPTGSRVACVTYPGQAYTPAEVARRRDAEMVRNHPNTQHPDFAARGET